MIWTIVAVLVVLWLLGMLFDVGGALLNVLLVIALIAIAWSLFAGRRSRV